MVCFFHLVDEVLIMVVSECLRRANNLMQVRVHELVHNVHVVEVPSVRSADDVSDGDHLPKPSQQMGFIIKA